MCPSSRGPPLRAAPTFTLTPCKPILNGLTTIENAGTTDLRSWRSFTQHMPSSERAARASKFGSKLVFGDVVVENAHRRSRS